MNIRRLPIFLLSTLLLALCLTNALAEELDISIATDKETYVGGEIVTMTIKITNTSEMIVRNLKIDNYIPTGLTYVNASDANKEIAEIQPGATVQHMIRVRKVIVDAPDTGDPTMPVLWIILLFVGASYLIFRKRQSRAS